MSAIPNALPSDFELLWYRISRVLGHGGSGITYLALDTHLDQGILAGLDCDARRRPSGAVVDARPCS
ncbi:MAG: hypothetical protein AAEJ43_03820 [Gammaproteobacteria bacterium]